MISRTGICQHTGRDVDGLAGCTRNDLKYDFIGKTVHVVLRWNGHVDKSAYDWSCEMHVEGLLSSGFVVVERHGRADDHVCRLCAKVATPHHSILHRVMVEVWYAIASVIR
jgi:hypothetical protein